MLGKSKPPTTLDELMSLSHELKVKIAHMVDNWVEMYGDDAVFEQDRDDDKIVVSHRFKNLFIKRVRQWYLKEKQILHCKCSNDTWNEFFNEMINYQTY